MANYFSCPEPRYIAANQTTVQEQVHKGAKLRQEKHATYRSDAACVNFIQPPTCPTTDRYWSSSPIRSPKSGKGKLRSPSYIACSTPCPAYPPPKRITKPKPEPRCPMRIVELATPTKRQCINTWRTKCDTLPGYMIERLRQQVMDECPIVGIPEAVYCFKRSKMAYNDRPCKVPTPRELRKRKRTEERRNMCMMFGQKIALELMSKRILTLDPQMDYLSKIVAGDISKVVCSRIPGMKNPKYDTILDEVSTRVTAWIADILNDTSYKLLEDDLRDLEKKEGPVLHFLNAIFDNVMKICEPDSDSDEGSKDGDISGEQEDTEVENSESSENVDIDLSTPDSVDGNVNSGKSDTEPENEEDLKTDIVNGVLDDILKFSRDIGSTNDEIVDVDIPDAPKNVKENFKEYSLLPAPGDELQNENLSVERNSFFNASYDESLNLDLSVEENEELTEAIDNNDNISKNKDADAEENELNDDVTGVLDSEKVNVNAEENPFEDASEDLVENLNQDDLNVSAVFGIFIQDLNDESYKHVVLSDSNIGINRKAVAAPAVEHGTKNDTKGQISWKLSSDHIRPNLVLPANQNLLSDADENWPEDITSTPIKLTQSVNKSVTSLGRIQECDEIMSPKDETYRYLNEKEFALVDGAGEKIYNTIDLENIAETVNTNLKVSKTDDLHNKTAKLNDDVKEASDYKDGIGKGDQNGTNKNLKKNQSQINKFDYKEFGSQTYVTLPLHYATICIEKHKTYHCHIREWCDQLDQSIDQMEMWKKWIQNTCKQIICFKKREETNKSIVCPRRKELVDWICLKENVDRDAIFWNKLYKHTGKLLKMRRQKYDLRMVLPFKQCDCS